MRRVIDLGGRRIVLAFRRAEIMDSTGLGAIVCCLKYVDEDGAIAIARHGERVVKVLKLPRMDRVFALRGQA